MKTTAAAVTALTLAGLLAAADPAPNLRPPPPVPVSDSTFADSVRRGVEYLVKTQNKDGSWGSPRWTGGVDGDPLTSQHSFCVATTALCIESLLEIGGDGDDVKRAVERGTDFLVKELDKLRRADRGNVPNIWGHGYGIQTLAALYRRTSPGETEKRERFLSLMKAQAERLAHFETAHGGWFYYASGLQKPNAPSCSFVNAAILICLKRGQEVGAEPPKAVVERALDQLKAMRNPDASFIYSQTVHSSTRPVAEINRSAGSLGRSQAGNAALRTWGDPKTTDDVIKVWLDRLVTRQGWLDMGRKRPIPHESHAAVAGYFYYFGHYYGSVAITLLPPAERSFYGEHLAKILIERQEEEGSWWDYPLFSYAKPYGTAFALLSLNNCRKSEPKVSDASDKRR
jgi:hypothetical protein